MLSGVDGAGKSTQLALLDRYLRSRGLRTHRLWLRWFSALSYFLYFYARLARRTVIVETRSRPVHVHVFWTDTALQRLYPRSLLLDLLLWFLVNKVIAWARRVHVLLIDRGFLDACVDLLWETRNVRFLRGTLARFIWKFSNDMNALILTVEPKEVAKRKSDIVSLKEIAFKKRCFEIFAKHLGIPVIDTTNKSVSDTFRELMKLVKLSNS